MKANANKLANTRWTRISDAVPSACQLLRWTRWLSPRKPLPTVQASPRSPGNVRQLSFFRTVEPFKPTVGLLVSTALYFVRTCGIVLALSLFAKVFALLDASARWKGLADPVFWFLTYWQTAIVAITLEVICLAMLRFASSLTGQMWAILWIGTSFGAYRTILYSSGFKGYCACMGSLPESIGLSPDVTSLIMNAVTMGFVSGSIFFLYAVTRKPA